MAGSSLLLLGHASADEAHESILKRGLSLLDATDLTSGFLDHPHNAGQCCVARQQHAEPIDAVLLQDAGPRNAVNAAEGVQQVVTDGQLEIDDRLLLDLLLEIGWRTLS